MTDLGSVIRQQVPHDARLFALLPGSKKPRTEHAHLDAVPLDEFLSLYVGGNYGIALDGQYLLVDKDRSDEIVAAFEERLPVTWAQKTWRRGTHRVYRVPPGFVGKNSRWPGGELKVNGYLVGPGSSVRDGSGTGEYTLLPGTGDPMPAPEWLLDMVRLDSPIVTVVGVDADIIAAGSKGGPGRDNQLASAGGYWRRQGFSESFIGQALASLVNSGLVEQPPGDEITAEDIARIARSVYKYTPEPGGPGAIAAKDWLCGSDVRIVGPPIKWWERGFFPKDELVMCFGESGVGKSSLASWLAKVVTNAGEPFLFVGVEEPFTRFLGRAVLGGAKRERIFAIQQASRIVLPRDIDTLRAQVELSGVKCVYFDAVVHHFERIQGENIAERARRCLGPLAEMAQDLGVTIIGVFHENKAGDYMGSTEMVNVARVVLHARRERDPAGQPLILSVHTTNLWEPDYALTFYADETVLCDPDTGQVQYEEVVPGVLETMKVRVTRPGGQLRKGIRVGDLVLPDEPDTLPDGDLVI